MLHRNKFLRARRRREGKSGHGAVIGSKIVAIEVALHHSRHQNRKNRSGSHPTVRIAELLPCSETQAWLAFSSSHRTCRQLLGDFDSATLSTTAATPFILVDQSIQRVCDVLQRLSDNMGLLDADQYNSCNRPWQLSPHPPKARFVSMPSPAEHAENGYGTQAKP